MQFFALLLQFLIIYLFYKIVHMIFLIFTISHFTNAENSEIIIYELNMQPFAQKYRFFSYYFCQN